MNAFLIGAAGAAVTTAAWAVIDYGTWSSWGWTVVPAGAFILALVLAVGDLNAPNRSGTR